MNIENEYSLSVEEVGKMLSPKPPRPKRPPRKPKASFGYIEM